MQTKSEVIRVVTKETKYSASIMFESNDGNLTRLQVDQEEMVG